VQLQECEGQSKAHLDKTISSKLDPSKVATIVSGAEDKRGVLYDEEH